PVLVAPPARRPGPAVATNDVNFFARQAQPATRAISMNQVWILAFGAGVAGLFQGIWGFAFAMVAMAIWVWGVEPQLAAVMAVVGGWTGQLVSAPRARRRCALSTL